MLKPEVVDQTRCQHNTIFAFLGRRAVYVPKCLLQKHLGSSPQICIQGSYGWHVPISRASGFGTNVVAFCEAASNLLRSRLLHKEVFGTWHVCLRGRVASRLMARATGLEENYWPGWCVYPAPPLHGQCGLYLRHGSRSCAGTGRAADA